MTYVCSRRQWLISLIPAVACSRWVLAGAGQKPMRGVFIIMATPYTASKEVDYEDLAREVDFLDRCKVHGMVWPQLARVFPTDQGRTTPGHENPGARGCGKEAGAGPGSPGAQHGRGARVSPVHGGGIARRCHCHPAYRGKVAG